MRLPRSPLPDSLASSDRLSALRPPREEREESRERCGDDVMVVAVVASLAAARLAWADAADAAAAIEAMWCSADEVRRTLPTPSTP